MRLRAITFVFVACAAVGWGAARLGDEAARRVEAATLAQVAEGLAAAGEDWTAVEVDGLRVTLVGAAPDEGRRVRAVEIVRRVVNPGRVRDRTTLAAADPLAPPPFAVEILRHDGAVSVIGLAPEGSGRDAIDAALDDAGLGTPVTEMLETVASPVPARWEAALGLGLSAVALLPDARVSVSPGRVAVAALAPSEEARAALEAELRAALPAGVALALDISAPRPVIAPFRLEVALDAGGPRVFACSAETVQDVTRIAAAAGLAEIDCALGLGAPGPGWSTAAALGVAALRDLGGGRFALRDLEATLTAAPTTPRERLGVVEATLAAALPDAFSLRVEGGAPEAVMVAAASPDLRFEAALAPDGALTLRGPVADATSREAIGGFAAALFGHDHVENALVVAPDLPEGWPGRVLAGVEALALMKEGRLEVTPEQVSVEGWAAAADGAREAEALLAEKAPGPVRVAVRFDAVAAAAEAKARALLEDPVGVCVRALAAAQARRAIGFEPGSALLDEAGAAAVAALTEVFAGCPPLDFEIAGHTDTSGRAEANQALSEARAEAVRVALEASNLPHMRFIARGYGPGRPIAANDTEAGRATNRRIEFTLLDGAAAAAAPFTEPLVGPR